MSLYSNYFCSYTGIRKCTLFAYLKKLLYTVNDQNPSVKYRSENKDTNYNKIDIKVKSCLPSICVSTSRSRQGGIEERHRDLFLNISSAVLHNVH